jgi:hypothetical protein
VDKVLVKVDGKVFNLEQPVIFGTIYIQPEYTSYSSDEAFNQIEHELHSFSTYSKYVGLIKQYISIFIFSFINIFTF